MMQFSYLEFVLLALVAVPLSWISPRRYAFFIIAVWTFLALLSVSFISALWLLAISVLLPMLIHDETNLNGFVTLGLCLTLVLGLFFSGTFPELVWIGTAFYTLRAIHVVLDAWMGRLPKITLQSSFEYFFFIPVIAAGPINRFENFRTQLRRRRWDTEMFWFGFDRFLLGMLMYFVLSGRITSRIISDGEALVRNWPTFLAEWFLSCLQWIDLFVVFVGSSHVALGISLMCGIVLEENFDRPWKSRNLIEFWQRWHITLTRWVLDYVYKPVVALTKKPIIGIIAAMLVVGLWHAYSVYYLLWALWQALGVILTRIVGKHFEIKYSSSVVGLSIVLMWLSAARPIIGFWGLQP